MLRLVARRALAQRRVLVATLVLLTAATVLLGVGSLLLGETQQRAFAVAVEGSPPQDVEVTAFLVGLDGSDLEATRDQARDLVAGVLAPMDPEVTTSATSVMRRVDAPDDVDGLGYLSAGEALDRRADLTSGRWPADVSSGPAEAALPDAALDRLGLPLGSQVTLGGETGVGGAKDPVTVVVVGTFRPRARAGWDSDPLSGAGFEPAYSDGSVTAAAYGPFVVTDGALRASGSGIAGVRVTAEPDLRRADDASLREATASLQGASRLLSARVGDRVDITRVQSDLPRTVERIHAQQASTRATVLVVLLLGLVLSLGALLLAGRLVATVRDDERALLVGLGIGRRQQLGIAALEAGLLAVLSALVALPLAALGHAMLTDLPGMRAAGLQQDPAVTTGLVLTVVAGAVLLTLALVVPALDPTATGAPGRRRAVARNGIDVLLLVVAAAGWWQLHSQPATAATSGDLALTLAPVLCLVGVTTVAVRAVPLLLSLGARLGTRSPALVLPLAVNQAARRPHTATAMVLLATSIAAATFGLALRATWERSQEDQAALRVGADLSLQLPAPATAEDEEAVVAATKGSTVSPVTVRSFALGHYVGEVGAGPVLVATDTQRSGALLRGRIEGESWGGVGATLAPESPVRGLPVADGAELQLVGTAPAGLTLTGTPTLVVEDAGGFRTEVGAAPIRLDGLPHPVRWQRPIGTGQVIAVRMQVHGQPVDDPSVEQVVPVDLELRLPPVDASAEGSAWEVKPLGDQTPVHGASVSVGSTTGGTVLTVSTELDVSYLAYIDADLVAAAFPDPPEVPVAVSQQLADAVGAKVGGALSANLGATLLPLRVTAIVPDVPSAPGRIAVLADEDLLSRALIRDGRLDPVVDGWWVADPTPETVRALRGLELGDVTTRDEEATELAEGPLRVTVPAVLVLLVIAGAVLLLAGVLLLVSADQRRRSAEVARLRALGLTRGEARRLLMAEHVSFLVPLVLVGALVGAASAALLAPALIRSDIGAAPVPEAVLPWPWAAELALVGGLLVVSLLIAAVVSVLHVRRAATAQLRVGDS